MEVVDDLFELLPYHSNILRWNLKDHVVTEMNNGLVSGDKVYFEYKLSKYTYSELEVYLQTLGCSRVKKIELADKIVRQVNFYGYRYIRDKPVKIDDIFLDRHKNVQFATFEESYKKFKDSQVDRFDFSYEKYSSVWNLLLSRRPEDVKLAAIGIMTMDWTDQDFLLRFLEIKFSPEFCSSNLGQLPNWSLFAHNKKFVWKGVITCIPTLIDLFKKYKPLPEEIELIHKLLNQ